MKKVTAIFDIGKTNKKFFLLDEGYQEVFKEYACIDEIEDDDNFPCENLEAVKSWIFEQIIKVIKNENFEVIGINFSGYGASFVHIDENGFPVCPLYNYLKPYPENIRQSFYEKYGDEMKIALETASPALGMLNSGFQLYWLKYDKPEIFKRIKWSLHFPQYLSYLFSGIPVSEYTSIGCHTGMWDYNANDYHNWIYNEGIDKILPPIISAETIFKNEFEGKVINVGPGIHDSSAALLPYILSSKEPFVLISTGTWSISLNPFSRQVLTVEDLKNDCLNYMRIDGKTVRASRLLLGSEYSLQINKIGHHFGKENGYHKTVKFDNVIFQNCMKRDKFCFHFENIPGAGNGNMKTDYSQLESYEEAYHQLMTELVELQAQSTTHAIGNTYIKTIYIDGGFADNNMYVKIMTRHFHQYDIYITQSPLGSALGAAMIISDKPADNFLKERYVMKKYNL